MKISLNHARLWLIQLCIVTTGLIGLTQTKVYSKLHKHGTNVLNFTEVDEPEHISASICNTPECYKVAEGIKSAIDTSVKPCDDFFLFSCGKWIKTHPIPKSYNDYSTFTRLSKEIERELRNLLEEPSTLETLPENEALRKAKDFYHSCMNTELIEAQGAEPVKEFIRDIGSWSICGDKGWDKDNWDIYRQLGVLQSTYYPATPFFSVEVTNDHLNSTKHLIKVRKVLASNAR